MGFQTKLVVRLKLPARLPRQPCSSTSYDAYRHDEILLSMWAELGLIPPGSKQKRRWDTLLQYLSIYFSVSFSLIFAFKLDPHLGWLVFDYVMDLLFLMDIPVSMRASYYNVDNEPVLDRKLIFERYRYIWLPVDAVGVVPWEVCTLAAGSGTASWEFALLRCFKGVLRFISQQLKPDKVKEETVHNIVIADLGRTWRLLTWFLFFTHWVACLWWIIGAWPGEEEMGKPDDLIDRTSLSYWPVRPNAGSISITWNTSLSQQYLSSYYWALSTLMKTAWIPPGTVGEKAFASCIVFVGAIIFASIVGTVSAVVKSFDAANAKRRDKMSAMRRFAETRKLSAKMTRQLLAYVDAEWTWTNGMSTVNFLKHSAMLPSAMRSDLLCAFSPEIVDSFLLKGVERDCVRMILEELIPQALVKKATLIQGGCLCSEAFILMKGSLQLTVIDAPDRGTDRNTDRNTRTDSNDRGAELTENSCTPPGGRRVTAGNSTRSKLGCGSKKFGGGSIRVIERPGSCVGFMTPYQEAWTAPFTVIAVRTSFLFTLRAAALKEILSHFDGHKDKEILLKNLKREFTQCVGKEGVAAQDARIQQEKLQEIMESKEKEMSREQPELFAHLAADPSAGEELATVVDSATRQMKATHQALAVSHTQLKSLQTVTQAVKYLVNPADNEQPDWDLLRTAFDEAMSAPREEVLGARPAFRDRSRSVRRKARKGRAKVKEGLRKDLGQDAVNEGFDAGFPGQHKVDDGVIASTVM